MPGCAAEPLDARSSVLVRHGNPGFGWRDRPRTGCPRSRSTLWPAMAQLTRTWTRKAPGTACSDATYR
jgi:hypothetical protein